MIDILKYNGPVRVYNFVHFQYVALLLVILFELVSAFTIITLNETFQTR